MLQLPNHITLVALLFFTTPSLSQNLTGTWEGIMGHEVLQINIKETGGKICGYTYDYFLSNRNEYCRAYFTGRYDMDNDQWALTGSQFIENSGSHVLMYITLWREKGSPYLSASVITRSDFNLFFPPGMGEKVLLRRIDRNPQPLSAGLPVCMPEPRKPQPVTPKRSDPKPARPKPPPSRPAPPATTMPARPVDTIQRKPVAPPVAVKRDSIAVPKKVSARKQTDITRLQVSVKNITLAVYDNGVIDGDTVSIYHNGKLLLNKKLLSAKPLMIELDLNEDNPVNEIVLFAENLGSIPPNTALIVVTAGDKRYELYSSASLTENAVLVFEYKPD